MARASAPPTRREPASWRSVRDKDGHSAGTSGVSRLHSPLQQVVLVGSFSADDIAQRRTVPVHPHSCRGDHDVCVRPRVGAVHTIAAERAGGGVPADLCGLPQQSGDARAPPANSLHAMPPDFIVEALTNGIMKAQGSSLSPEQRASLAEYLTGQRLGAQAPMAGRCSQTRVFSLNGPSFNGWGANAENWRYQAEPGISATQRRASKA